MKNLHLNKISISNARRFSKDVEIDFGKGATIILAPNGTGKTTIFEAIELALTGTLESRLGDPPNALIRDGKQELDIRLDFDDGLFCGVSFRHGNPPILNGDRSRVFGDKIPSAPYLLGLTHILDQRGKGWFVTSDENGAGDKLDKLSIGQGLNKIASKRTSLTRVVNQEIDKLNNLFTDKTEIQKQFSDLVEVRNSASFEYKLMPLEDIYQLINDAHLLINDSDSEVELKQDKLTLFLEKTKVSLNNEINNISNKKIKFSSVEIKLETYKNNCGIIEIRENELKTSDLRSKEFNEKLVECKQKIDTDDKIKNELHDRLKNIEFLQDKITLLGDKKKQCLTEIETLERLKRMFENQQAKFDSSNKQLNSVLKLIKEHEVIDSEINQVSKKQEEILELNPQLDEWKRLSGLILNISEDIIPNYEKEKVKLSENLAGVVKEVADIDIQIKNTNQSIKQYEEGANVILNSVTSISKHLPDNQEACPVCNTSFSPKELQNQIKIALESMDPAAHNLTQTVKELEKIYKELNDKRTGNISKIKELENNISQQNIKLNEANEKLAAIMKAFPNCSDIKKAQEFISSTIDELKDSLKILDEKKKVITEKPSERFVIDLRIENGKVKVDFEKCESELKVKQLDIKKLFDTISGLEEQTKEIDSSKFSEVKETLTKDILSKNILLNDNTKERDDLIRKLENLKQEYNKANSHLLELKSHQSKIETEWSELGLQNKPDLTEFKDTKDKIENLQRKCSSSLTKLNEVEQQLVTWQKATQFIELDKKVKSESGENSEEEHLNNLKKDVSESKQKLEKMKIKQATINSFFNNVASELQQVNKYVENINQPWNELLNRIIVNSLFSTGDLLTSSTYRNRPRAAVGAILNGNNIPVNQIASEAQLTDLQLTFMLAMAKQHHWTPWRALLLDDPTQHHDLVHASSVFDLLRDYISDLDFQVLLSTHDSQQVNFFRRKLENDGIDNKVYRLKVSGDGVFAD
ncbi:MAG: AAA family ATPase [Candidatus Riflebacteria bacterium]|nr:AAA family ATPase [Candidatus Riflebacteria bacterium]